MSKRRDAGETLPKQLRKLADDIEAVVKPKQEPTPNDMVIEVNKRSLKERIQNRRDREAEEDAGRAGDANSSASSTFKPKPTRKKRKA